MRATTRASGARCVCSHRRILATAAASLHPRLRSCVFHSAPSDQCSSPALFHGWVLHSILSNYSTIHPQLTLQMCPTQHLTCTCTFIGFICTCLCRSLCVADIGTRIHSQWAMVGFSDVAPCTEPLHGIEEGLLSE